MSTEHCHILIVEDHGETREILARMLAGQGYRISTAGSVREAIRATKASRFDLALCDLGLPDGTGYAMFRELQYLCPMPGIVVSGYGTEPDITRSAKTGFFRHLCKPIDLRVLVKTIEDARADWIDRNR